MTYVIATEDITCGALFGSDFGNINASTVLFPKGGILEVVRPPEADSYLSGVTVTFYDLPMCIAGGPINLAVSKTLVEPVELVPVGELATLREALRDILDFVVSGKRYDTINPYFLEEVQNAITALGLTNDTYNLGDNPKYSSGE